MFSVKQLIVSEVGSCHIALTWLFPFPVHGLSLRPCCVEPKDDNLGIFTGYSENLAVKEVQWTFTEYSQKVCVMAVLLFAEVHANVLQQIIGSC